MAASKNPPEKPARLSRFYAFFHGFPEFGPQILNLTPPRSGTKYAISCLILARVPLYRLILQWGPFGGCCRGVTWRYRPQLSGRPGNGESVGGAPLTHGGLGVRGGEVATCQAASEPSSSSDAVCTRFFFKGSLGGWFFFSVSGRFRGFPGGAAFFFLVCGRNSTKWVRALTPGPYIVLPDPI